MKNKNINLRGKTTHAPLDSHGVNSIDRCFTIPEVFVTL